MQRVWGEIMINLTLNGGIFLKKCEKRARATSEHVYINFREEKTLLRLMRNEELTRTEQKPYTYRRKTHTHESIKNGEGWKIYLINDCS